MKTKKSVFTLVLFWISSLSLSAQALVSVKTTISQDTLLTNIQRNSLSSKTVIASGQAEFSSKSGYVRILLSDDSGYDLLVYESSPLLAVDGTDNFNNISIEAIDISSNPALTKVRVEIKNAELKNLSIDVTNTAISKTQQQKTRTDRIALINSNLRVQNALWMAGETSISEMSYEEKKGLFGGKVPDLQGFEYYVGGIFELASDTVNSQNKLGIVRNSNFVDSFDWRNRHGRNWMTSVKKQGHNECSVFAVTGAVEALVNLYYNQPLNLDLAEQEIVSCLISPNNYNCASGTGWSLSEVLSYYTTTGVVDELCFQHPNPPPNYCTNIPCANICSNPSERIKIAGGYFFPSFFFSNTEETLKYMLINYGPMAVGLYTWGHAMTLAGFGKIKAGDSLYIPSLNTYITIGANDPRIGKTYWIFKQSAGASWGVEGWWYSIIDLVVNNADNVAGYALVPSITRANHTDAEIVCEDQDGDGYYYWGIGPKPATCPACAPDDPDGDDSKANLGPMDIYGNCADITNTPLVDNITTSQTWNTNRDICRSIVIQSGATLTITATATVLSKYTITIQNGGKLIVSGGTIDGGSIVAQSGSELTISNNGKVLLNSYDNFKVHLGAVYNLIYGKVSLK